MNARTLIRRNVVILGVVFAVFVGAATIRAAASWTAASAPLKDAPTSLQVLRDSLAQEQARSAALQSQLDQLEHGSSGLAAALNDAQARITSDAQTADDLRASLAAANAKLTALEASIASAGSGSTGSGSPATTSTGTTSPGGEPGEAGDD